MNAIERIYHYRGSRGCECKCGLSIVPLKDGRVTVICTELPDNPGTSITNFAEDLAGLHLEADVVDGFQIPVALREVGHLDHGRATP